MEDGLVIDEKEFDTFPLLLIIILWKFHFGTAAMPYDSFAHKKKGWAFLPTTFVFSVIGKSIEKLFLQKVLISAFVPGSCLKLLEGTAIITSPCSLYLIHKFYIPYLIF